MNPSHALWRGAVLAAALTSAAVWAEPTVEPQPPSSLTTRVTEFVSYKKQGDPVVLIPPAQAAGAGGKNSYRLIADISYLGEDYPERADLYLPLGEDQIYPAILDIHGGGWLIGDKTWQRVNAGVMVSRGFAVFTINYLLGRRPTGKVKDQGGWPRNLLDCKTALRFMRAYADKLHIDPNRIAVSGQSAGGHLALLTGLSANLPEYRDGFYQGQSEHVSAIVNFYGVTDLRLWGANALFSEWDRADTRILSLASPVDLVVKASPPILTLHGGADKMVDFKHAESLDAAARKHGAPHELIMLEGASHGFKIVPDKNNGKRDLTDDVVRFLEKHLGGNR